MMLHIALGDVVLNPDSHDEFFDLFGSLQVQEWVHVGLAGVVKRVFFTEAIESIHVKFVIVLPHG